MKPVVIIGGGPAGLTAAYQLRKAGLPSVVLEKDNVVGGISRTATHNGYRFDIGGHRFFTKVPAVEAMWREVLAEADFLRRQRLLRIYYNKRFFHYPLRPANALLGLGLWNSAMILASYIKAQMFPQQPEHTFERWVSNRFGERLYRTFFKTYTEKVWGIPCHEISAEWAAQRIKGLSLLSAVKNALLQQQSSNKSRVIKTLIDAFDYPRRGPGMMWEAVAALVHEVRLGAEVQKIIWSGSGVESVETSDGNHVEGSRFISSMPLRELISKLSPAAPPAVQTAANGLKYRDFLTVALILNRADVFPDNWIYIHDPDVKMGRIQNYKNWSPDMVPDAGTTCLGLEYFCFAGDGLWTMQDEELIALGKREIETLGLARAADVVDGCVVRMPKAYPVYDAGYSEHLRVVREFLGTLTNLQVIGRNGMHRYNNQDHSMLTAMLAVENIRGAHHDLWSVNDEQEYHEEIQDRRTPHAVTA
jgi:protoporphyrinogen oxidase